VARRETRLLELRDREAPAQSRTPHAVGRARGIADPELLRTFTADAALGQVSTRRIGLGRVPQESLVETCGGLEQREQAVAFRPPAVGLGRALLVLELDSVAIAQPPDGGREAEGLGSGPEPVRPPPPPR